MHEDLELRELLRLSQTNVTRDPNMGLEYAEAAYLRAQQPEYRQTDPTAAGEAAAKAGFRAEQLGHDVMSVIGWFNRSHEALAGDDTQMKREHIATHLLEGRSLALRALKSNLQNRYVAERASQAFAAGEEIIQEQHQSGERWDPYAVMLSRHRATHEAIHGRTLEAAGIAIEGMRRAMRVQRISPNYFRRLAFNERQTILNYSATLLALSKPLDFILGGLRRRIAQRMLG